MTNFGSRTDDKSQPETQSVTIFVVKLLILLKK